MTRLLFITKYRDHYYAGAVDQINNSTTPLSSGLFNSARFIVDMLHDNGIEAKLVQVIDNNEIDREVSQYKPTHVIIEAIWVVPSKFEILRRLHPGVKWIVRNHSETPFLANEGNAINWMIEYLKQPNVYVAPNSDRMFNDTKIFVRDSLGDEAVKKVIYLPNHYVQSRSDKIVTKDKAVLNVGCFGAIRPMKNQLLQAIAAMDLARRLGKRLHFHINVGRVENKGDNVLRNLRALFACSKESELIEHKWHAHGDFIDLIHEMDLGMQVSLSETFNIVTADFVSQGIPVVTSEEIRWVPGIFHAEATNVKSIVEASEIALAFGKFGAWINMRRLDKMVKRHEKAWIDFFKDVK